MYFLAAPVLLAILVPVLIGGITYLVQRLLEVGIDELEGAKNGDPETIAKLRRRAQREYCQSAGPGLAPDPNNPGACIPQEWLCPEDYNFGGYDNNENPICYPPAPRFVIQQAPNLVQPPPTPPTPPPPPPVDPKLQCLNQFLSAGFPPAIAANMCGLGGQVTSPTPTVTKENGIGGSGLPSSKIVYDTSGVPMKTVYDVRGGIHYAPLNDEELLSEMRRTAEYMRRSASLF